MHFLAVILTRMLRHSHKFCSVLLVLLNQGFNKQYIYFYITFIISVDDQPGSISIPSVMLWLLNFCIIAFCLVKMFVYGDPILPEKSKEMQKYWSHRKQADALMRKVKTYNFFLNRNNKYCRIKNMCRT